MRMQIAVIGGGAAGVSTAFFLAGAGHQVALLERYGNVAQEISSGNAGLMSSGNAMPWAAPGMPQKLLRLLFRPETPVSMRARMHPSLWRWLRRWMAECEIDRFRVNKERLQRLANYSGALMAELVDHYPFEYEKTGGLLQLFRSQEERRFAEPALEMLAESGVEHRLLEPEEARCIEPALAWHTPLNSALYLPRDEAGNCPLFIRQLRNAAQQMGVAFHFDSKVDEIAADGAGVALRVGDQRFHADAVVLATGAESIGFLRKLRLKPPFYPVKSYSATVFIRDFDHAPCASVLDETYKINLSRLGTRVRLAGTAEIGFPVPELRETALRTLVKVGEDWFPQAANYNTASFWSGVTPMLPDGGPLLGPTPLANVWLNISGAHHGWAMAVGAGRLVSDMISGHAPQIDTSGLTLARF
jgi:D-amino-acid dehydrogenase